MAMIHDTITMLVPEIDVAWIFLFFFNSNISEVLFERKPLQDYVGFSQVRFICTSMVFIPWSSPSCVTLLLYSFNFLLCAMLRKLSRKRVVLSRLLCSVLATSRGSGDLPFSFSDISFHSFIHVVGGMRLDTRLIKRAVGRERLGENKEAMKGVSE